MTTAHIMVASRSMSGKSFFTQGLETEVITKMDNSYLYSLSLNDNHKKGKERNDIVPSNKMSITSPKLQVLIEFTTSL